MSRSPKVEITILQRRALRKALALVLDQDDNREQLQAWEIKALQKVGDQIQPVGV